MTETLQVPRSDRKFRNLEKIPREFSGFLKWIFNRDREAWPIWIDSNPGPAPAARVTGQLRITFINHSTFLIQVDGANILTDPVWSEWAGPMRYIGRKRVQVPGIRFEDLPEIDAVLVSHNHYDHMDIPTLKSLEEKFSPFFITGLGNREFLEKQGLLKVEELDWWDYTNLPNGKKVFFVPAQHCSGRAPWNIDKTLWGGFVTESSMGQIYFAGDTGFGRFFEQIHERFPDIRVALLPIGAYKPRWFMSPVHIDPDDAVQAHKILKPQLSIGIHLGTFPLTDEGIDAPARELEKALKRHGMKKEEFIVPGFGKTIILSNN